MFGRRSNFFKYLFKKVQIDIIPKRGSKLEEKEARRKILMRHRGRRRVKTLKVLRKNILTGKYKEIEVPSDRVNKNDIIIR